MSSEQVERDALSRLKWVRNNLARSVHLRHGKFVSSATVKSLLGEAIEALEASQQEVERLREIAINVLITRIGFTEQQAERKVDEQLAALEEASGG